jgi:hypothetical protein
MLNLTQQGIVDALRTVFLLSEVPTIYLTEVPADFQRPSFFLDLLPWRGENIASDLRLYPISWQLVYFPSLDEAGNEDVDNLRAVAVKLDELFGQVYTLPLPDGSMATITDFSWEERDGDGYATIALSVVIRRVDEEPVLMQNVELVFAPKKGKV